MTRSCAKPTCSNQAVSWFALLRERREVTRSDSPTGQGMALCQMHADRFTVPVGWTLKVVGDSSEDPEPSNDSAAAEAAAAVAEKDEPKETAKAATASKSKPKTKAKAKAKAKPKTKAKAKPKSKAKKKTTSKPTKAKPAKAKPKKAASKSEKAKKAEVNAHARETAWFVPDSFEDEDSLTDDEPSPLLGEAAEGSLLDRAFNGPTNSKKAAESAEGSGDELPFPPHGNEVSVS